MTRLFYHVPLNIAWMQANQAQQFLFTGVCGCPKSTKGQGGILINTLPEGVCNFCGRAIEMTPLLAYNQNRDQWLELFANEAGQLETKTLTFQTGAPGSGPENTHAIHPNE